MSKPDEVFNIQRFVYLYRWAGSEGLGVLQNEIYPLQTHGIQKPAHDHDEHFWNLDIDPNFRMYVGKARTPELETLLIKLEDAFSQNEYKFVRRSELIGMAIQDNKETAKKGTIEALALEVHKVRNDSNFILGIRTGIRLSGVAPAKPIFVACLEKTYVFEGDEDDIIKRIGELPRKKTQPTPKKVLSKMVGLRLQRLKGKIEDMQKRWAIDQYSKNQYKEFLAWKMPDFNTVATICNLKVDQSIWRALHHAGAQQLVEELIEIFNTKKDVDDEIVDDAWNRVLVGEVMES